MAKVSVVCWGNIEDPDAPRLWGLRVGKAYVSRGKKVELFKSRDQADAARADLQARLDRKAAQKVQP